MSSLMPFCFKKDGKNLMLFCESVTDITFNYKFKTTVTPVTHTPFKIHVKDGENVKRIETGSCSHSIETSPSCFYDGDKWVINFLCQFYKENDPRIMLYRMTTTDWASFTEASIVIDQPFVFGFENNLYLVSKYPSVNREKILIIGADGSARILALENRFIDSVSYRSDDVDKILVTCFNFEENTKQTLMYSITTKELVELKDHSGNSVCYCSVLGDAMWYSKEEGQIEECEVKYDSSNVLIKETKL